MGRYFEPLYRIVFSLPVGDTMRAPVKWHHLTEFCLCVLAGFGLEAVRCRWSGAGVRMRTVELTLGAIVIFGACDLARCAKYYCAAVDLSVVRAENPAAELVKKLGGGKVADLMEGGNGLVAWSFTARGVKMTANPAEDGVRFIWAPVQTLNNPQVRAWLKEKKAVPAGAFTVTAKAIRSSDGRSANVMLMELPGVPAVPEENQTHPPVTFVTLLGAFSLAGTLAASAYGMRKSVRRIGVKC
jgi:hypothetical protein